MPQLWVFAGPNGSGKTTLAQAFVAGLIDIVNPDEIAYSLAPGRYGDPAIGILAGRQAIERRHSLLEVGATFAIETTLTGRGELRFMQAARDLDYKVNLVFVCLASLDFSRGRVAERVKSGGHPIPDADLVRRFDRSLGQLPQAMRLADRSVIVDNTGKRTRLVLIRESGVTRFLSQSMPAWAHSAIPAALRQPKVVGRAL